MAPSETLEHSAGFLFLSLSESSENYHFCCYPFRINCTTCRSLQGLLPFTGGSLLLSELNRFLLKLDSSCSIPALLKQPNYSIRTIVTGVGNKVIFAAATISLFTYRYLFLAHTFHCNDLEQKQQEGECVKSSCGIRGAISVSYQSSVGSHVSQNNRYEMGHLNQAT